MSYKNFQVSKKKSKFLAALAGFAIGLAFCAGYAFQDDTYTAVWTIACVGGGEIIVADEVTHLTYDNGAWRFMDSEGDWRITNFACDAFEGVLARPVEEQEKPTSESL